MASCPNTWSDDLVLAHRTLALSKDDAEWDAEKVRMDRPPDHAFNLGLSWVACMLSMTRVDRDGNVHFTEEDLGRAFTVYGIPPSVISERADTIKHLFILPIAYILHFYDILRIATCIEDFFPKIKWQPHNRDEIIARSIYSLMIGDYDMEAPTHIHVRYLRECGLEPADVFDDSDHGRRALRELAARYPRIDPDIPWRLDLCTHIQWRTALKFLKYHAKPPHKVWTAKDGLQDVPGLSQEEWEGRMFHLEFVAAKEKKREDAVNKKPAYSSALERPIYKHFLSGNEISALAAQRYTDDDPLKVDFYSEPPTAASLEDGPYETMQYFPWSHRVEHANGVGEMKRGVVRVKTIITFCTEDPISNEGNGNGVDLGVESVDGQEQGRLLHTITRVEEHDITTASISLIGDLLAPPSTRQVAMSRLGETVAEEQATLRRRVLRQLTEKLEQARREERRRLAEEEAERFRAKPTQEDREEARKEMEIAMEHLERFPNVLPTHHWNGKPRKPAPSMPSVWREYGGPRPGWVDCGSEEDDEALF